jgi:hypothetical protein
VFTQALPGIEVTAVQNSSVTWLQKGNVTIVATGVGPGSIGGEPLSFALLSCLPITYDDVVLGIQFNAFVPFVKLEWVQEGSVTMDIEVVEGTANLPEPKRTLGFL